MREKGEGNQEKWKAVKTRRKEKTSVLLKKKPNKPKVRRGRRIDRREKQDKRRGGQTKSGRGEKEEGTDELINLTKKRSKVKETGNHWGDTWLCWVWPEDMQITRARDSLVSNTRERERERRAHADTVKVTEMMQRSNQKNRKKEKTTQVGGGRDEINWKTHKLMSLGHTWKSRWPKRGKHVESGWRANEDWTVPANEEAKTKTAVADKYSTWRPIFGANFSFFWVDNSSLFVSPDAKKHMQGRKQGKKEGRRNQSDWLIIQSINFIVCIGIGLMADRKERVSGERKERMWGGKAQPKSINRSIGNNVEWFQSNPKLELLLSTYDQFQSQ